MKRIESSDFLHILFNIKLYKKFLLLKIAVNIFSNKTKEETFICAQQNFIPKLH